MVYPKTVIQISESLARCEIKLGELASHGRSIQAGSLCYNNRGAVDVSARLDVLFSTSSGRTGGVYTYEVQRGGLAPRGRSIQAGSLCYNNRGVVDVDYRFDVLFSASSPEDWRLALMSSRGEF